MDDVADDDLIDRGLVSAIAVALDLGRGLDHLRQGLCGDGALLVLDESQHAGDEHHGADDERGGEVALGAGGEDPVGQDRDDGDEDEDVGEGVREGRKEANRLRALGRLGDGVRAVELAGGADLVRREAFFGAVYLAE